MSLSKESAPKSRSNCVDCLNRDNKIFCGLEDAAMVAIDKAKITNHYKRGQYVFYAGNQPAGLYCVSTGVVKLEAEGANGNGHILRVVQAGGGLGYRSLFAEEPYEANAVVHDDATICLIPKTAITELMEKHPKVAMKMLQQVSRELHSAEARLCGQTDKNAGERIAEAVIFLKENFADQNWTRKEIAEWAGTTPETVMRFLATLEDDGVIEQKGRKIEILNRTELFHRANLSF
jgi:CRP-like cAMP-binding protein